ncbi:hypothetical protein ACFE04_014050 [Oxalis oulophora]
MAGPLSDGITRINTTDELEDRGRCSLWFGHNLAFWGSFVVFEKRRGTPANTDAVSQERIDVVNWVEPAAFPGVMIGCGDRGCESTGNDAAKKPKRYRGRISTALKNNKTLLKGSSKLQARKQETPNRYPMPKMSKGRKCIGIVKRPS